MSRTQNPETPRLTASHRDHRPRESLLTAQVGDRVTCNVEPDPQDTGTVTDTTRQTHTDNLVQVDWDHNPHDHDWYSDAHLTVTERANAR